MARYITSVSLRNQAFGFIVGWGFGWALIVHPPRVSHASPVFFIIGCGLIVLGLIAVRNMVRLILSVVRTVVGLRSWTP
jgi:hypothetical protein